MSMMDICLYNTNTLKSILLYTSYLQFFSAFTKQLSIHKMSHFGASAHTAYTGRALTL